MDPRMETEFSGYMLKNILPGGLVGNKVKSSVHIYRTVVDLFREAFKKKHLKMLKQLSTQGTLRGIKTCFRRKCGFPKWTHYSSCYLLNYD